MYSMLSQMPHTSLTLGTNKFMIISITYQWVDSATEV